jgi:hypothetical protein
MPVPGTNLIIREILEIDPDQDQKELEKKQLIELLTIKKDLVASVKDIPDSFARMVGCQH